jgi:hypothetical protein
MLEILGLRKMYGRSFPPSLAIQQLLGRTQAWIPRESYRLWVFSNALFPLVTFRFIHATSSVQSGSEPSRPFLGLTLLNNGIFISYCSLR